MNILIFDMDGTWGWANPRPDDTIIEAVGIVGDWQTWRILRLDGLSDALWEAGKAFFFKAAGVLDGDDAEVVAA